MTLRLKEINTDYQLATWDAIQDDFAISSEFLKDNPSKRYAGWEQYTPKLGDEFSIENDRFRLEKFVGKGNFKTVFEATRVGRSESSSLPARVAAVFWRVNSTEKLEEAAHEARCFTFMRGNPGVIQMLDMPERVGKFSVRAITDLCDNGTLDSWAKGKPVVTRLKMTVQVAKILQGLHKSGIAHGDIKCANIGIDGEIVKLLDIGSSTQQGHDKKSPFRGTLAYAPPGCDDEENSPIERDVFALGVVIYDMMVQNPENLTFAKTVTRLTKKDNPLGYFYTAKQEDFDKAICFLPVPVVELLHPILRINPKERIKIDEVISKLERAIAETQEDFFGFPSECERDVSEDFFA